MELQEIKWIVKACVILTAILTFVFLFLMTFSRRSVKLIFSTYEEVGRSLKRCRNPLLDYQKLKEYLECNGAGYHFGKWITPVSFTLLRLACAGGGMLLGSRYQLWAGMVMAVICYWIPDILLYRMNTTDNEKLLPEIKLIYHAISMQMKAGVYVTDALAECYANVKEKRLRDALLVLSGDIAIKADVEEALERFQGKFDNSYVDTLCMIILQALESGQAVELLADMAEQIKDMEVSYMNRKRGRLDRSITFYQLGILTAILTVVLYACVTHMMSAAVTF